MSIALTQDVLDINFMHGPFVCCLDIGPGIAGMSRNLRRDVLGSVAKMGLSEEH